MNTDVQGVATGTGFINVQLDEQLFKDLMAFVTDAKADLISLGILK